MPTGIGRRDAAAPPLVGTAAFGGHSRVAPFARGVGDFERNAARAPVVPLPMQTRCVRRDSSFPPMPNAAPSDRGGSWSSRPAELARAPRACGRPSAPHWTAPWSTHFFFLSIATAALHESTDLIWGTPPAWRARRCAGSLHSTCEGVLLRGGGGETKVSATGCCACSLGRDAPTAHVCVVTARSG